MRSTRPGTAYRNKPRTPRPHLSPVSLYALIPDAMHRTQPYMAAAKGDLIDATLKIAPTDEWGKEDVVSMSMVIERGSSRIIQGLKIDNPRQPKKIASDIPVEAGDLIYFEINEADALKVVEMNFAFQYRVR